MNWGHEHNDADQQDWWSSWQTTLFPLVAYRRVRRFVSDTEGIVVAESRAYLSPDILHSNAFVQYVNEDTIRHYQGVFKSAGRTLKHVHFWSDGCGAQFKNKNQFYWLLTGSKLATDESPTPLRIAHHFFQSCHGKGQCQSCLSRSPAQPSPALSPARPSKGPALLISQPPSSALSQPGSALLIISQPSPAQPSPAQPSRALSQSRSGPAYLTAHSPT
jgi:hypothetical protein